MERAEQLRRVLAPLQQYLDELVLIGGWVAWLYLNSVDGTTSLTVEADVLIPVELDRRGRPPLAELLNGAGFTPVATQAIWEGDVKAGEKIEFFVAKTLTARQQGNVRPVPGQPGVGAITLDSLWPLAEMTEVVNVPGESAMHVRVPALGIYVVNKASTFSQRPTETGQPRAGKDLLYLADLAATGDPFLDRMERDLIAFAARGRREHDYVERGRSHLHLLLDGRFPDRLEAAVLMRVTRNGGHFADSRAYVEGGIASVRDVLESVVERGP